MATQRSLQGLWVRLEDVRNHLQFRAPRDSVRQYLRFRPKSYSDDIQCCLNKQVSTQFYVSAYRQKLSHDFLSHQSPSSHPSLCLKCPVRRSTCARPQDYCECGLVPIL